MGVLSNSLVMKVFLQDGVLSSPKNILHINLAFANILVVAGFPFSGLSCFHGRWLFGKVGCDLYGIESYTGGIASFTFVILLCFERYLSNCHRELYKRTDSFTWWLVSMVTWLHALVFGISPIFGWSEYSIEASGVACGPNWMRNDLNHVSYIGVMCLEAGILLVLAILCINAAKKRVDSPIIEKISATSWFSEKQLVWICFSFVMIAAVGWGPYAYFAVWTLASDIKSISMLAASCPPLFAKASASLYAIPYLVAAEQFRERFCGVQFTEMERKSE
ncbi:hypothetical protein FSP39_014106 [Pinctada imbricata]|uniref:G-protein coupled receptors family 1 profile domain-containing protein n=1 Tax=Pinctada imbricata TaxID=66713 RepID=A0AA88XRY4_PINIB|nr:hypothetical protein FSP39_014106 [Pinctada imbricata]